MRYLFLLIIIFAFPLTLSAQKEAVPSIQLMQDEELQIEATEAINNMYNFKFGEAEVKFQELLKRFPEHPLPFYLMGLSNWWKMMPYEEGNAMMKKYEPEFDKYMELSIAKAEKIYNKNEDNIEATFFLCASHALIARYCA
jgi:hypothetical protein